MDKILLIWCEGGASLNHAVEAVVDLLAGLPGMVFRGFIN